MAAGKHAWQGEIVKVNHKKSNGFMQSCMHFSPEKNMKQVWRETYNLDFLFLKQSICMLRPGDSEVQFTSIVVVETVVVALSPILLF